MAVSYDVYPNGSCRITKNVFLRIPPGAELTIFPEFFLYCNQTQLKKLCRQVKQALGDTTAVYQDIIDILNCFYYFETIKPGDKKKILAKIKIMEELITCEMTQ